MAVRLVNLHRQPLRVELRGGAVLVLPAGARSQALREELLYDNDHLAEWERAGWLRRLPARMRDVEAEQPAVPEPPAVPRAPQDVPATRPRAPRARKSARR